MSAALLVLRFFFLSACLVCRGLLLSFGPARWEFRNAVSEKAELGTSERKSSVRFGLCKVGYLQPLLLTGEDALPFPNSPRGFADCSCESDQHHITICTSPSSFLDYLTVSRSWATFCATKLCISAPPDFSLRLCFFCFFSWLSLLATVFLSRVPSLSS